MRNGTGCQAVKASFMQVYGKGTSQMTGKPMYIIIYNATTPHIGIIKVGSQTEALFSY